MPHRPVARPAPQRATARWAIDSALAGEFAHRAIAAEGQAGARMISLLLDGPSLAWPLHPHHGIDPSGQAGLRRPAITAAAPAPPRPRFPAVAALRRPDRRDRVVLACPALARHPAMPPVGISQAPHTYVLYHSPALVCPPLPCGD
eukprot:EG_transcript_33687